MPTNDRLGRLANLTRGAARVGSGAGILGCTKSEPSAQPNPSGPLVVTPAGSEEAGAADASTFAFRRRLPVPNAIPKYAWRLPDAGRDEGGDAQP